MELTDRDKLMIAMTLKTLGIILKHTNEDAFKHNYSVVLSMVSWAFDIEDEVNEDIISFMLDKMVGETVT